jgi:cathepsin B
MPKYSVSRHYSIPRKEDAIMTELYTHGPVTAGMIVYKDFGTYKSGIYHHVTGGITGLHVVKIIGWGVEGGVKYWKVANSWNTDWGENGFFRIRRGSNECEIEEVVTAADPKL